MKLKDHVLIEHKTIRVAKNGIRYICRILSKGTTHYELIAKHYGCSANFYMDFTRLYYNQVSRRYLIGWYHPIFKNRTWFGFDTFESAIKWLKDHQFKILPKIHRKARIPCR